jgi:hypothetical protein
VQQLGVGRKGHGLERDKRRECRSNPALERSVCGSRCSVVATDLFISEAFILAFRSLPDQGVIEMTIDLHGYHPSEIVQTDVLRKIILQTWEMGDTYLTLIHGHGRNRGISPGFVNTNTGFFGLEIRRALRHDIGLRQWIKYTMLDCSDLGATSIKLKPNPAPTRSELDNDLLPEGLFKKRSW